MYYLTAWWENKVEKGDSAADDHNMKPYQVLSGCSRDVRDAGAREWLWMMKMGILIILMTKEGGTTFTSKCHKYRRCLTKK